jgi:hypothetical protein
MDYEASEGLARSLFPGSPDRISEKPVLPPKKGELEGAFNSS